MKKVLIAICLTFSAFNAYAEEIMLAGTDEWVWLLPIYPQIPAVRRNPDGTLVANIMIKGKGTQFGKTVVNTTNANCSTKQIKVDNNPWETPNAGSVNASIVRGICNYTK